MPKQKFANTTSVKKVEEKKKPEEEIRELTNVHLEKIRKTKEDLIENIERIGVTNNSILSYIESSNTKSSNPIKLEECLPHVYYLTQVVGVASKSPSKHLSLLRMFDLVFPYFSGDGEVQGYHSGWRCFCSEVRDVARLVGGRELEQTVFNYVIGTRQKYKELMKNGCK